MTSIAIGIFQREKTKARRGFSGIRSRWSALLTWYARRQTLRRLYGIEPRLLRDMGVDPAEVYGSFPRTGVYAGLLGGIPTTPAHERRQ